MPTNPNLKAIGRPVVEKATNGLRKITRRYVVHGPAASEAVIESQVFLPFCTADEEFTDAFLIEQKVEGGNDTAQTTLLRTYLEVNETPVEIGRPKYTRDATDHLTVERRFIVETDYPVGYQEGRIGTDIYTTPADEDTGLHGGEECVLAKIEFIEHECYTEYTETYKQYGSIGFKEEIKHNGKLFIRTYRTYGVDSLADLITLRGPEDGLDSSWALTERHHGTGNADYNLNGYEVRTWELVKGEGRILEEEDDKGSAIVQTEVIILPDGDSNWHRYSDIPAAQVYETRVDDKDGYDMWTIRGVVGSGEIERREETKHNGALSVITIKNIGEQSSVPTDYVRILEELDQSGNFDIYTDVYVKGLGLIKTETEDLIGGNGSLTTEVWITPNGGTPATTIPASQIYKESLDERDGYEIHTIVGVIGSGALSYKTDTRHNGALTVVTIKNIGVQSTPPAGYVRVSEEHDQTGRFDVYTDVYVKGQGLISSDEEDKGAATVTTEVWITPNGGSHGSTIPSNQIYRERVEEKDGYEIHTLVGVVGSGELERRTETKNNGALSVITIRNIGSQSTTPSGYVRISEELDQSGNFDVYTDVYARGDGRISVDQEDKGGGVSFTTEVWLTPPSGAHSSTIPAGQIYRTKVEERDGHAIHTVVGVTGSGEIKRISDTKFNGALLLETIWNIGTQSSTPSGFVRISEEEDDTGQFTIYKDTYAKGSGLISTETEDKGNATVTTEVWLTASGNSHSSTIPADQIFREKTEERDGYLVHTVVGVVGSGVIEESTQTRHNGALTIKKYRAIGAAVTAPAGYAHVFTEVDSSGNFEVYTDHYAKGQGQISTKSEEKGNATITTEVWLTDTGNDPATSIPTDQEISRESVEQDGYTVHTITGVTGSGEIYDQTETKLTGSLVIRTIKNVGDPPTAPAGFSLIDEIEDNSGTFTVYTHRYAKGDGLISASSEDKGSASITTETWLSSSSGLPSHGVSNVYFTETTDRDGHWLHTIKGVVGSGLIEERIDEEANGAIMIYTYKSIGAPWTAGGELISTRVDRAGNFDVYTNVYVTSGGTISYEEHIKGNATITTETEVRNPAAAAPAVPAGNNLVKQRYTERDGYILWYTQYIDLGAGGNFYERVQVKHNGALTITTRKAWGGPPPAVVGAVLIDQIEDNEPDVPVFTEVWAEGNGRIAHSQRSAEGGRIYRTVKYLNVDNVAAPAGAIVARDWEWVDGQRLFTITYLEVVAGEFLISSTTNEKGIEYRTIGQSGAAPAAPAGGFLMKSKVDNIPVVAPAGAAAIQIFENTYAIPPSALEYRREVSTVNGVTRTRSLAINAHPPDIINGAKIAEGAITHVDRNGGAAWVERDTTIVTGVGEISRKTTESGQLRKTTVKWITDDGDLNPVGDLHELGAVIASSEDQVLTVDGNVAYIVKEQTLVTGEGEISRSTSTRDGVVFTTTEYVAQEVKHPADQEGAIMSQKVETLFDVDGAEAAITTTTVTAKADDEGVILDERVEQGEGFTKTRIRSAGGAPPEHAGCIIAKSTQDVKDKAGNTAYNTYDYTFLEASDGTVFETSTKEVNLFVSHETSKVISNSASLANMQGVIEMDVQELKDVDSTNCKYVITYTRAIVTGAGTLKETTSNRNGVNYTTTTQVDGAPPNGCIVKKETTAVKDLEGSIIYNLFEYVSASGQGEVETSTTQRGGVKLTTKRSVGTEPTPPAGSAPIETSRETLRPKDVDGSDCSGTVEYRITWAQSDPDPIIYERTVWQQDGSVIRQINALEPTTPVMGSNGFVIEDTVDENGLFPVYTKKTYTPPTAYDTRETHDYRQLGEINLNPVGQVNIVKAPITRAARLCNVHVSYDREPLDVTKTPEVLLTPPVYSSTVVQHDSSMHRDNSVWNGYKAKGVEDVNLLLQIVGGIQVRRVFATLSDSVTTGDPQVVFARSREYYRHADSNTTIFRNTLVTATAY